jgi:hypothetical protein
MPNVKSILWIAVIAVAAQMGLERYRAKTGR